MKFRKFGAVSLAAILAATSTAIVASAVDVSEKEVAIKKAELAGKDVILVTYKAEADTKLKIGFATAPDWAWNEIEFTVPAGEGAAPFAFTDALATAGITDMAALGDDIKIYPVDAANPIISVDLLTAAEAAALVAAAAEAPAAEEEDAAADADAEAEDEAEDVDVDADDDDDDDDDIDEDDDDDDDADDDADADAAIDALAAYDLNAALELNASFELGGKIDLLAALGEDWDKFTTIEATFTWTPGEKWCGGAGIGAAVNCNGDTWIMGSEFGAANANEAVAPDGKATQVILEMAAPLQSIYSVGDDGSIGFGELQVQNWWNGVEAGAKVQKLTFKDADGNVVKELTYGEAEEAPAPVTGDVDAATDSSKGSPDTGIEDVAVVAGLAALAAGAVVVAKKRK